MRQLVVYFIIVLSVLFVSCDPNPGGPENGIIAITINGFGNGTAYVSSGGNVIFGQSVIVMFVDDLKYNEVDQVVITINSASETITSATLPAGDYNIDLYVSVANDYSFNTNIDYMSKYYFGVTVDKDQTFIDLYPSDFVVIQ